jgi:ketosteroid isomerase-like protein
MASIKAVWFVCASALLCFAMSVPFSTPAFADDADLKRQVAQINSAYMESFNKQDVAGLAALYATGAIIVGPAGARTDITQYFEGIFKAGINHAWTAVDQIWPLGSDTALGLGKYRVTGTSQSGAPIENAGLWTATYVREGGKWKVRMLTGVPQPPPAAK